MTNARIKEQLLRDRLLEGKHKDDVIAEILESYAPEIAEELRINPDMSANPFLAAMAQLAVSYDQPPTIQVEGDPDLSPIITPTLWVKMQDRDLKQRGINEVLVRLDWPVDDGGDEVDDGAEVNDDAEVGYRVISPGYITDAEADPRHPSRPLMLEEFRMRTRDGEERQTWETWDVRDPAAPVFRIEEEDDNGERVDMTEAYTGSTEYPYQDTTGAPIFPYVLYHSKMKGRLWSFKLGTEMVRGTLRLAAGWSSWWDAFDNGASPVRVSIDLEPPAGVARTLNGTQNVDTIVTSPKTILKMNSTRDGVGRIDTFPPGLPPLEGVESLRAYEERLAVFAGLNPGDLKASGDVKSGISIIVSREGQRRAQRKSEPVNRSGDQQLLATAARLANSYGGASLPEKERDYRIEYAILGLSQEELTALLENLERERSLGLISPVTMAMRRYPSIETEEEALAYLVRQSWLNAQLRDALSQFEE